MTALQWFDFISPFAYTVIACTALAWWAHRQAREDERGNGEIKPRTAE